MRGIIRFIIVTLLIMSISTGCTSVNPPVEGDDTRVLQCTPDEEWTNLWVNYEGWTGADGIYSIPLDGNPLKQCN